MTTASAETRRGRRRFTRRGFAVGCLLSLSILSTHARATGRSNAGPTTSASIEQEPLQHHAESAGAAGGDVGAPASPAASTVGDLSHVALALAIVIGIIFGLRWVARRFALVPTVGRPGRGVKLLSRTILSPKQQVLLIQVGRRVVVVGDGGAAGMRALCEITDPDEVAALVGELKSSDASAAGAKSFGSLFRRAAEPFGGDGSDPSSLATPPVEGEEAPSDVVGLLDKVRGLRQQFDR